MVANPDRAAGRGRRLRPPPVKTAAAALGLPVLQPDSPRDPALAEQLRALAPDALAVVAYSILPNRLLRVPRLGSVNVHPSLLPAYRGAAPIVWALFDGCTETGVTTFLLNRRVDGGDILLQEKVTVGGAETAGELEARLAVDGARLLVRSLDGLEDGSLQPRPQAERRGVAGPEADAGGRPHRLGAGRPSGGAQPGARAPIRCPVPSPSGREGVLKGASGRAGGAGRRSRGPGRGPPLRLGGRSGRGLRRRGRGCLGEVQAGRT